MMHLALCPCLPPVQARSLATEVAELFRSVVSLSVKLRDASVPADIANLVALLVSPAGAYVTGCTIPVDGGLFRALR